MSITAVYGPGLYQIRFGTYPAAVENLRFLGWVEEGRSVPAGSKSPSEVRYFNRLIGGNGRLFHGDDGWVFLAADGWLMKVYAKLKASGKLESPSQEAKRLKLEAASTAPAGSVLDLFGDEG